MRRVHSRCDRCHCGRCGDGGGQAEGVRPRSGVGDGDGAVLGARLRRSLHQRPHRRDRNQPAQPLRRVRIQEELFRCAVRRYLDGPGGFVAAALQQPRAWDVAEAMIHGAADAYTDPDRPAGVCSSRARWPPARTPTPFGSTWRGSATPASRRSPTGSTKRKPRGNCRAWTRSVLARWINSVCQGFSVQARSGATREELHRGGRSWRWRGLAVELESVTYDGRERADRVRHRAASVSG